MLTKTKLSFIILVVYFMLCISPYFIDGLNQINPKLFGIPFTVWSGLLLLGGFCCYLLYLSNAVWDSYTTDQEGGKQSE